MMSEVPADHCKLPRVLWRTMAAHGLVLPALDLDAPMTTAEYFAFFRAIEAQAKDPALGMKLVVAAESDTALHPPTMLAAFHAASYREAITRLVRFKRLLRAEEVAFTEHDGEFAVTKQWLHTSEPEPALSVDIAFGILVELGRRGTGKRITAKRVEFARKGPLTDAHAAYFGGAIVYGAPRDRLVLHSSDLELPFPAHHPELLAVLTPALVTSLGSLIEQRTLLEQVKWVLKRDLTRRLGDVASELKLSERTLQRRITEEGTTFRDLVVDARQELGRQLLADPSVTVEEIAFLLGYQDTSSFYRAFREREGVTPAQWRKRLAPHAD